MSIEEEIAEVDGAIYAVKQACVPIEHAKAFIEMVKNTRVRIPFIVGIEAFNLGFSVRVRIHMHVEDRDHPGIMIQLYFDREIAIEEFRFGGIEAMPALIQMIVHEAVAHEVDECIYINGTRVFDPHIGEER